MENTMENHESHKKMIHLKMLLWTLSTATSFGGCIAVRMGLRESIRLILMTVVLSFLLSFYIQMKEERVLGKGYASWLIGIAYGASILSMIFLPQMIWAAAGIVGSVALAGSIDFNLGLFMMYGLGLIRMVINPGDFKEIAVMLVLGTIVCLCSHVMKSFVNMIYVLLLTVTMKVSLEFLLNDFKADKVFEKETMVEIAEYALAILICFGLNAFFAHLDQKKKQSEEEVKTPSEEFWEDLNHVSEHDYHNAVSEEAALLVKLKQESDKLYQHSKKIALISQEAAQKVGANAMLACAGGWYHEIGRLNGKDYVNNGVQLIEEYHLPKPIADIIREQNFKEDAPKSKEAAIVMLTDNIVGTFSYLKANPNMKIAPEKVIENTFSVRLGKGTLNESGLTLIDYNTLKEYYLGILPELSQG